MRKKMKGFTLIELIAVLVIMTIIALIVTPLVMSILRKARVSADKRSIDAYGRSIELAIAGYLMDTGSFPTQVSQLIIEYSGSEVVCETTQLNPDSSVYLSGCTVGGRSVDYAYGSDNSPTYTAYSVGDHVSYNDVTYYVIEDSGINNDTVKLLKENPLLKTEIDDLNLSDITVTEENSYALVSYGNSLYTTDYANSMAKYVVDAWKNSVVKNDDNATARLITKEEIEENFEIEEYDIDCGGCGAKGTRIKRPWSNSNYSYWTMSQPTTSSIWYMDKSGNLNTNGISSSFKYMVRPVLELNKSADISIIN